MNPQFDLLRGHCFAQLAGDLVGHGRPHPAAFGGHPPRRRGGMTELVARDAKELLARIAALPLPPGTLSCLQPRMIWREAT